MIPVLLGLGSNTRYEDFSSMELLSIACKKLKSVLESLVCSSVYITKARYVTNQDDFYNMVVKGYVPDSMTPYDLLNIIHDIEAEGGRNREKEIRFGPRSLDIDIEEFGDTVVSDEILQIPHPRIQERAFVFKFEAIIFHLRNTYVFHYHIITQKRYCVKIFSFLFYGSKTTETEYIFNLSPAKSTPK